MDPSLSEEENIRLIRHIFNVSEIDARFILAIEKGEIPGDVIELPTEAPVEAPHITESREGSRELNI